MRLRTVAAVGGLLLVLAGLVVVGLGVAPTGGGTLTEAWVSETPRDNEVNHHAVGVDPAGDVIVAPVAEVPYSDAPITDTSCTLARLDPADFRIEYDQAVVQQKNAGVQLRNAVAQLAVARSSYERTERLYENNSVALSDYERARSAYETARAQVEAARAQVTAAENRVLAVSNQLSYTRLTAPFAGIISAVTAEVPPR